LERLYLPLLTYAAFRAGIERREFSCEEVARAYLDRIALGEAAIHAWAFVDPDLVLQQARALDRTPARGALHGLPLGVKDVIDTFDMPTQMGSPIYAGYRPVADASCVALARAAGAVIFGKTVTAEFAGTHPGATVNPLDHARTPGGSSSGSAAAVADGMVAVAFGTQTGGSVHRPASYCGVSGFKPTQSAIERTGVKAAAERFDTVGIIAHDFDYIDALFSVLTNGYSPDAAASRKPARAAICRTPFWPRAQPETMVAVDACVDAFRSAGVEIDELTLPAPFDAIHNARATINAVQRAHALRHEWQVEPGLISDDLAAVIRRGLGISYEVFAQAVRCTEECRASFVTLFGSRDVVIAPCVDGEAPLGLASTGEHHFQSIWTTIDVPTASLPFSRSAAGLPVSVQLVGLPGRDLELLGVARWLANSVTEGQ
jgi:Asp-tRNA(Asn)/Glu-tRNA(Gln) amidotransferase A subunit family amidase